MEAITISPTLFNKKHYQMSFNTLFINMLVGVHGNYHPGCF